jgi:hypothetical protein
MMTGAGAFGAGEAAITPTAAATATTILGSSIDAHLPPASRTFGDPRGVSRRAAAGYLRPRGAEVGQPPDIER